MTATATIDVAGATCREWGAVVVGAGPAGAVAARQLARLGIDTLLIEKATFPRDKVCGCCVNGSALDTLAAIGLGGVARRCGAAPLRAVRLAAGGRAADVRLPSGVAVSRAALDSTLAADAVAAGANFLPGTAAKRMGDGVGVFTDSGVVSLNARVVIAADGLNGRLPAADGNKPVVAPGSRVGAGVMLGDAPAYYRPGTIYMAVGRGGYVGAVRVEDRRLDLAAAFDPEFVRTTGGLGPAAAAVIRAAGFPEIPDVATAPWRGTPALTRTARRVAGPGWFAVGDSAGYVEPFTGEGMAWAIAGGVAVAPIAARAVAGWSDTLAEEWATTLGRLIRSRQAVCRAAAAVLRSPVLSRWAVRALAVAPALACPVVASLNRPARVRGLQRKFGP